MIFDQWCGRKYRRAIAFAQLRIKSCFALGAGLLSKVLCSFLLVLIVLYYMFGWWDTPFYESVNVTRDHSEHLGTKHGSTFSDHLVNFSNDISTYYPTIYFDGNTTVSFTNTSENITTAQPPLPLCPPAPPNLNGTVEVKKSPIPSLEELEKNYTWLQPGGHFSPPDCQARNRVAFIIPYFDRAENLLLFLQHMHPFLRKQQIEYTIFIIEQNSDGPFQKPFNKAMIMNVGFKEALKIRDFDCFIFHDVDLLPEDERNLYTCPDKPRHMSVAIDKFEYKLPYQTLFGGVIALTKEQFITVNGFSNSFVNWGGEDDDMYSRVTYHNFSISRYSDDIARYTMLKHQPWKLNEKRYENLEEGEKKFDTDGLNNLKYVVVESQTNLLYTWFLVNLRKPS